MYISKKDREIVRNKFGGKCAYSGTELKEDWQVDHIKPIIRKPHSKKTVSKKKQQIDNLFPCQRIINHYKGSMNLELFRTWYLGGLHKRLKKLPKNPKANKSIQHKTYLLEVASFFEISEDCPFNGKFYFEMLEECKDVKID